MRVCVCQMDQHAAEEADAQRLIHRLRQQLDRVRTRTRDRGQWYFVPPEHIVSLGSSSWFSSLGSSNDLTASLQTGQNQETDLEEPDVVELVGEHRVRTVS